MTNDTDQFSTLEIVAITLIGEAESLGIQGMTETACVIMNRAKANLHWLGGNNVRGVCLQKYQFDCWYPEENNEDRDRITDIALRTPTYGPYMAALGIAATAINGTLADSINSAVSYFDSDECKPPNWSLGKTPCYVNKDRKYYDLAAITAKPLAASHANHPPSPTPPNLSSSEENPQ